MKKLVSLVLSLALVLSLCAFASAEDYSGYTIRIYSNSNSTDDLADQCREGSRLHHLH